MSGPAARKRKKHKITSMTDDIAGLKKMRSMLADQLGSAVNGRRDTELDLDIVARALIHVVYGHPFPPASENEILAMDWLCDECHAALGLTKSIEKAMEEMEKKGEKPGEISKETQKVLDEAKAAVEAEPKPAYTPRGMRGDAPA